MDKYEQVKLDEGYSREPYIDVLVKPTIPKDELAIIEKWLPKLKLTVGYGSLCTMSKEEASWMLEHRLEQKVNELVKVIGFYDELTQPQKHGLQMMSYQLGTNGLLKFKKMLKGLKDKDPEVIEREALNSLWARQTPNRAERMVGFLVQTVEA